MNEENHKIRFGLWAKIAIAILAVCIFNVVLVSFTIGDLFWAKKSGTIIFSDLLFFEGIAFFGLGALIASGYTAQRIDRWQSLYASPDGHREYLEEQRPKQFSFGIIMMIVGAILIGLSIALFLLA